jgi:hypothetical protein
VMKQVLEATPEGRQLLKQISGFKKGAVAALSEPRP